MVFSKIIALSVELIEKLKIRISMDIYILYIVLNYTYLYWLELLSI